MKLRWRVGRTTQHIESLDAAEQTCPPTTPGRPTVHSCDPLAQIGPGSGDVIADRVPDADDREIWQRTIKFLHEVVR
jgi:hypothetical protein